MQDCGERGSREREGQRGERERWKQSLCLAHRHTHSTLKRCPSRLMVMPD